MLCYTYYLLWKSSVIDKEESSTVQKSHFARKGMAFQGKWETGALIHWICASIHGNTACKAWYLYSSTQHELSYSKVVFWSSFPGFLNNIQISSLDPGCLFSFFVKMILLWDSCNGHRWMYCNRYWTPGENDSKRIYACKCHLSKCATIQAGIWGGQSMTDRVPLGAFLGMLLLHWQYGWSLTDGITWLIKIKSTVDQISVFTIPSVCLSADRRRKYWQWFEFGFNAP